ncbi:hypothetical protein ACUN9Y_11075 [Halomonas sp. V046]|uniref:hypothetical protein n=1 Tax=Halomonas sp. V046 TaxID=3459611 RepID=UPI0040445527
MAGNAAAGRDHRHCRRQQAQGDRVDAKGLASIGGDKLSYRLRGVFQLVALDAGGVQPVTEIG